MQKGGQAAKSVSNTTTTGYSQKRVTKSVSNQVKAFKEREKETNTMRANRLYRDKTRDISNNIYIYEHVRISEHNIVNALNFYF